jgi:hypothetical protein
MLQPGNRERVLVMKINVQGVRVDSLPFDAPAGYFCYEYAADGKTVIGLRCGCPCGCGAHHGARFGPNAWGFDGNLDKPTVTGSFGMYPSYRNETLREGKYHWHGFLRAGSFEEC